jgi:hypothetical protein
MDEKRPLRMQETSNGRDTWTELDESELYQEAFVMAVNETEGATWADGNIRM